MPHARWAGCCERCVRQLRHCQSPERQAAPTAGSSDRLNDGRRATRWGPPDRPSRWRVMTVKNDPKRSFRSCVSSGFCLPAYHQWPRRIADAVDEQARDCPSCTEIVILDRSTFGGGLATGGPTVDGPFLKWPDRVQRYSGNEVGRVRNPVADPNVGLCAAIRWRLR
jgi:hypothetical protein